ncbi:hypothetical protein FACS1894211_03060 [Clostridia bacterium]|nr:hypothetical protein FACS1894211_03060 [Clostridia bacterium]
MTADGYTFIGWSDGNANAARRETNVQTNLFFTANFSKTELTVHYAAGTGGTITGNASQTIEYGGDATTVTATPDTRYRFVKWSDNVPTAERTDTNITAAIGVTASFEKIPFAVTYNAGTGGSITGSASQTIEYGENATTVTAAANTGYRFVKWSDNVLTVERTDTNVTAAIDVTADFEKLTYTITYAAGTGGSITGNASQTVEYGGDATMVTAMPDTGYRFVKWSDNVTTAERMDTNVTAAVNVTAHFEKLTYTITYTAGTGGTITGNASQTVEYGGDATTVTAMPDTGYRFVKWSDNVTTAERTDTNVTAAIHVTAEFERDGILFFIRYGVTAGGSIYGPTYQTVEIGETTQFVTVAPLPNAGYIFDGWSDGVSEQSRTDTVTGDLDITAIFRRVFTAGKGTPSDPYLIGSYQNLIDMVYFPASYFKLTCDLNLAGEDHQPIFNGDLMFDGEFDGNGHTIDNMRVDVYHAYPSLFGCIFLGSVKNLNITNFEIIVPNFNTTAEDSGLYVGAVCGDTRGALTDITVSGTITGGIGLQLYHDRQHGRQDAKRHDELPCGYCYCVEQCRFGQCFRNRQFYRGRFGGTGQRHGRVCKDRYDGL